MHLDDVLHSILVSAKHIDNALLLGYYFWSLSRRGEGDVFDLSYVSMVEDIVEKGNQDVFVLLSTKDALEGQVVFRI